MNIITVIPIHRARTAPFLSYFTSSDMPVGSIVTIPVRKKTIHGIVSKVESAESMKQDIKDAPYATRKLGKIKASIFFPASFMESADLLAEHYASTAGAVIDSVVSNLVLENAETIAPPLPRQNMFGSSLAQGVVSKEAVYAVQGDDTDRMSSWRSLIRQEFARKRSIVIYAPTVEDCESIYRALEKGIEGYIFRLNGGLTRKKFVEVWMAIADTDHPVVVVSTGSFPVLPRSDIDTVIVERENGRGWKNLKAPYVDFRLSLETIARRRKQTVFLSDSLLSTETLKRLEDGKVEEGSPFKWRSISTARDALIDMKSDRDSGHSHFRVLSPELEKLIRDNREDNTHLFILALRRGLATMTVCGDCESIVTCRNCSAPVVLHNSAQSGRNYFMCHKCGERRAAEETCTTCGSWNLVALGIGTERVAEEIAQKFPDVEIFRADSDATPSEKQTGDTIEKWRGKPGSVLIGTEMTSLRISDKIDHVAVASLDSLFSLPDFRIEEKVMYMLIRLRAQATRSMLVQTRRPEERVFEYGLKGNLSDFYRLTLSQRKQFKYPPFSTLIKLTIEGRKDKIAERMAGTKSALAPREPDIFPAFTSTLKGKSVIHGLITVPGDSWPDRDLVARLRALPPDVSVKVDPDSLL